jgi:hypothetical protein
MPATSSKQKKFMDAAAHNPSFAQQSGIPQSVAKDFSSASKGMKFGKGPKSRADLQRINKPDTKQGKNELFKKGGDTMASKMNPGFMAMMAKKKGAAPSPMGKPVMKKGMDMAKNGMKMAGGGMPMKDGKPAFIGDGKGAMKHGGMTKKMASGGSASKRADGIAQSGNTQGKMLKKGGMAC